MHIKALFIHRSGRQPLTTDLHAQLHRRDAIVRILRQTAVGRQAELVDLLRAEGFDATQSSVSRDLRELGVLKGADRYLLPAVEDALTPSHFEDVQTFVKGYRAAGPNLTVLRTTTGTAQSVAIALDKARWPRSSARSPATTRSSSRPRAPAPAPPARAPAFHLRTLRLPMTEPTAGTTPILLAFSGGLDTSFCVPWLAETYGRPVVTLTVNTGSIDDDTARMLEQRSKTLGAVAHYLVDARPAYFEQVIRFLIMGNVRRGKPLPALRRRRAGAAGADRRTVGPQARHGRGCARLHCRRQRPGALRSGATHARPRARDPRSRARSRLQAPGSSSSTSRAASCQCRRSGAYSVNRGLWGTTIGGKETLVSSECIPDSAWVLTRDAFTSPHAPERHTIGFEKGIPSSLDGRTMDPVSLIEAVEALGARFGIGRGIHLGDTIIGFKGRVAFEAPAAEILLTAHRELEKLVLSHGRRASRTRWPALTATSSTRASTWTRCAATWRRCSSPRSSA